jgi:hypothetical protein
VTLCSEAQRLFLMNAFTEANAALFRYANYGAVLTAGDTKEARIHAHHQQ